MANPLRDTPREVTERLTAWGGKNEYGDPYWRVILAENHIVQRAGMWTEFEPGVDQFEFDHLRSEEGSVIQHRGRQIAPDAIRVGVFEVPLYPCTGWILERWFPPSAIGTREQWESALSQDGVTPMMGPYPEKGHYFMLSGGGPWERIPPLEQLRQAVAQWENSPHHLHGRMDEEAILRAMRHAEEEATEREQASHAAFLKEAEYAVQNNLQFIKNTPQLSAFRNRIAQREGLASHI